MPGEHLAGCGCRPCLVVQSLEVVLKNGRPAVTGQCVACGAKKFRMGAARK